MQEIGEWIGIIHSEDKCDVNWIEEKRLGPAVKIRLR